MNNLRDRVFAYLKNRIDDFVNAEPPGAAELVSNDLGKLRATLRKGDVVLVEGRTRISRAIRLFTHSQWTHVALYIGDELWHRNPEQRAELREAYGDCADKLLVEALVKDGVVAVGLNKYADHQLRICRPIGLGAKRLRGVLNSALRDLGKQYDNRNIIDLAFQLLPFNFGPFRKKSYQTCIGACSDFEVMCSGVIAKAFQSVGFLIRPTYELGPAGNDGEAPVPVPVMKHPSRITPKDFDLSCSFAIIKVPAGPRLVVASAPAGALAMPTPATNSSTTIAEKPPDPTVPDASETASGDTAAAA